MSISDVSISDIKTHKNVCVHVYVSMCPGLCVYVSTPDMCVCVSMYVCVCVCVCFHVCVCMCLCMCPCMCVYVSMPGMSGNSMLDTFAIMVDAIPPACVCVCLCVCVCARARVCARVCARVRASAF